MNFFKETFVTLRWLLAVMRAFLRVRPVTTTSVVVLSVVSRITGLLATFLPLKVILLVGSSGIPRHFKLFMDPENADKTTWIMIFSALAVLAYFLTQLIDSIAAGLSERASMDVLSGANEMAVASKMRAEAQTYYSRFADVCTSWMFGLIGLVVLPFVNMTVFLVVTGLMLAQLLFTALVIEYTDPHRPGRLRRTVTSGLSGYLEMLATIDFLAGFLTILATYLFGVPGNILIAILSIILMRRCFAALGAGIRGLVLLSRRRSVINPLVFRTQTAKPKENAVNRSLRELFRKSSREQRTRAELKIALGRDFDVSVRWTDSRINNLIVFHVEAVDSATGEVQHFQQQVFPAKQLHLLENEEFLFSIVSRDSLNAPAVVARFEEGPFTCQLCEYGRGKEPPSDDWAEMLVPMVIEQWGFQPPRKLVSAFRTAKPSLSGRLTRDFIKRISVAIDSPDERVVYKALLDRLEDIGRAVERVPLYIANPDFTRTNMAWNEDGSVSVMTWGRWSIAPIGSRSLDRFSDEDLDGMLREIGKRRGDVSSELTAAHLRLVNLCCELESNINKEGYKAAIGAAAKILQSPVLQECHAAVKAP